MSLTSLRLLLTDHQILAGFVLGVFYTLLVTTVYAYLGPNRRLAWLPEILFVANWLTLAWVVGVPDAVISHMFFFGLIGMLLALACLGWILKPGRRLIPD